MSAAAPVAASMAYQVELTIACKNLSKKDVFSKSDPMCVVLVPDALAERGSDAWTELGRTEPRRDTLNPSFSKTIVSDFRFEVARPLKLVLVDVDAKKGSDAVKVAVSSSTGSISVSGGDALGVVTLTLGEIAGSVGMRVVRRLESCSSSAKAGSGGHGDITVTMQPVVRDNRSRNTIVSLKCAAAGLAKKDIGLMGGSSDPYLKIGRLDRRTGRWTCIYRSEVIKKCLDPRWLEAKIPYYKFWTVEKPQQGQYHMVPQYTRALLRVRVFDWDGAGADDLIGVAEATLDDFMRKTVLTLTDKKGKTTGSFVVEKSSMARTSTFVDYLRAGCAVNLIAAVDFTASNGDLATDTSSLHYNHPTGERLNPYRSVLHSVGSLLGCFDRDGAIPAFAFGAKAREGDAVSHCLPLNGNRANPSVRGVHGLLEAYAKSAKELRYFGPTHFAEVVRAASGLARHHARKLPHEQNYVVLLIITDGECNDLQETIEEIAQASVLPMSIVIVGVGEADFSAMSKLDGDKQPLKQADGKAVSRDIVQFVRYNKFAQDAHELSRQVLAEVPARIESYFGSKAIKPLGAR